MSEITLHTINSDKKQSVLVCLEHSIESNYLQARALLQQQGHAFLMLKRQYWHQKHLNYYT